MTEGERIPDPIAPHFPGPRDKLWIPRTFEYQGEIINTDNVFFFEDNQQLYPAKIAARFLGEVSPGRMYKLSSSDKGFQVASPYWQNRDTTRYQALYSAKHIFRLALAMELLDQGTVNRYPDLVYYLQHAIWQNEDHWSLIESRIGHHYWITEACEVPGEDKDSEP
jgi:hypothetical protein